MAHQLRVLGPPEVVDRDGHPVSLSLGKPLALLIYVACATSPVSRDELADLLWPGTGRQKGRHSVRQALWVLRNAFEEEVFASHDPLSLREGILEVDLHRFSADLGEGRVEEARSRWRGPVLDHFVLAGVRHWNQWAEELRSTVEIRFGKALLQHAESLAEGGEAEAALSVLNQAVEVAPASEPSHLAKIKLLLDLLRLDAAREALADAHGVLGDTRESFDRLTVLEERLDGIVREQRSRVAEGESFPMEFVGRSRELAELHALWRDADLGRTRVAVITGSSGIGKTRLGQELLSYVSGDEVRTVALKGTRAERNLRWGAASELVRQLLRLPGSAGISSASDSLLRAMLPSMGRAAINLQTVNGVSPAAILDAVTDLLESVTFEAPLLVLVDDFQWVDQDSRTLFLGLANRSRELRVLSLILGRSGMSSRHWEEIEASLVAEAGARRFVLEPLIEEEVGELLALGAAFPNPEDAAGIVSRIHRASAGNPLFITEVLKELHEKGILQREGPGWVFRTAEIPQDFELPENIRMLLRERMERLSEPASNLAATLAQEERKASAETLQRLSQLPPTVFTQAVAELLERGVIEWVNGSSLDFVHDLLRETALRHLYASLPEPPPKPTWIKKNRTIAALAAGMMIALPLGILWGAGVFAGDPDPPLFGGGTIVFRHQGQEPFQLEVTAAPPEEWRPTALDPAPPPGIRQIFPAPGGGFFWFAAREDPEGPDMTRILADGSELPIFPDPGDQTLYDLLPDGSKALFVSENVGKDPFSHSLFQGWLDAGRKELIYEGSGPVVLPQWSPDGDLVAFAASAFRDTLVVSSAQGERVGSAVLGTVTGLTWCGRSLVAASSLDQEAYLLRFEIPSMTMDTLARIEPGARPSCSPDGTALAYVGVLDRRLVPLILELESGEIHSLPLANGPVYSPRWFPSEPPPFPRLIRAEDDTVQIDWGEERKLGASVFFTDGTASREGIRWQSTNPAVASVGPYEELTGNGVGRTRLLARWGYSLVDTVVVEVVDVGSARAILAEDFQDLTSEPWIPVGSHPPEIQSLAGQQVLSFRGDEKYTDGLVLTHPLPVTQGITVEMEFKMTLTRIVHQNFGFCIQALDLEKSNLAEGFMTVDAAACVHYPAEELQKSDPTEASVTTDPGRKRSVRVPEVLPPDDWVHIALQLRADGEATLVLNRQRVAIAPVRLQGITEKEWFLLLQGDAVGTELYVRNLTVWPGERY